MGNLKSRLLEVAVILKRIIIRRVIAISRKKWGRATVKTERIIREAILKPEVIEGIDEYISKARSITSFDLANRFNIRLSVAKRILREKEAEGKLIPYVRERGFVVYTTQSELEKREVGAPVMLSDVLEEVASSVPIESVITEDMDAALAAASIATVKPSKLRRQRREFGERKERSRDKRPEIVVEPFDEDAPKDAPTHEVRKKLEEREFREEISDAVAVEEVPPIADIKSKRKSKPKPKPEVVEEPVETAAKTVKEKPKPKKAPKEKAKKAPAKKKEPKAVKEEKPKKAAPKKTTKKEPKAEKKPKKTTTKKTKEEKKPAKKPTKKTATKKSAKEEKPKKTADKKTTKKETTKTTTKKASTTKKTKKKSA